jgi:hypothetical protein
MGVSRKPNNYNTEPINKDFGSSPDSLVGCLGYFSRRNTKCKKCEFQSLCLKVVPRSEVEKFLREILEVATKGVVK